jgi:DNA-binding MarR family transcriptional regulator
MAGTDPVLSSVGYLLLKAGMQFQPVADRALEAVDLTGRQFLVLTIAGAADPLSQLELSRRMHLDPTIVVGLLDELEERGLVRRTRDPADRRRHRIELTGPGRKTQARAAKAVAAAELEFLGPLSAADRKELRGLLLEVMRTRLPWLDEG